MNIISAIALVGVTAGTIALVVVLSVFNGFDVLIKSFFSVFDPEIKIEVVEGKQFDARTTEFQQIKNDPSVLHFCEVAEEIAHFRFEERQTIAYIKGVDDEYLNMTPLDSLMYDGRLMLNDGNFNYVVIGRGLAYNLGASANLIHPIFISVPKKGRSSMVLSNPFKQQHVFLSGVYAVNQQEVDDKYALIPIGLARELLDMDSTVTSVELALKPGTDVEKFQKQIQTKLGSNFKVLNRYQQHESYYKVAESERFFIFLILCFILVIASFNLISSIAMLIIDKKKDINILGSLSMLIIDKKADISILQSMGANQKLIRSIFLFEGWMVSFIGAVAGIAIGILVCLGQMHFGWLKFPGNFAVENYPVAIRWPGIVIIFITVMVIGGIASWLPVRFLPKKFFELKEE